VPIDGVATHDFGGKDKPVVLYCAHGRRSAQAAETLRSAGYTHVYLLGPMSAWGQ
jgi:adenylyltransferase/sulfurtransferase